jgi:hypothetical protein
MKPGGIISRAESLQILKNELRKRALEERAAELRDASGPQREQILADIDQEIKREIRRRAVKPEPGTLLY